MSDLQSAAAEYDQRLRVVRGGSPGPDAGEVVATARLKLVAALIDDGWQPDEAVMTQVARDVSLLDPCALTERWRPLLSSTQPQLVISVMSRMASEPLGTAGLLGAIAQAEDMSRRDQQTAHALRTSLQQAEEATWGDDVAASA